MYSNRLQGVRGWRAAGIPRWPSPMAEMVAAAQGQPSVEQRTGSLNCKWEDFTHAKILRIRQKVQGGLFSFRSLLV